MSVKNKAVVRRIVEDLFNTGDAGIADEVFAAGYVDHTASDPALRGPENVVRFIEGWRAAFPDTRSTIDDIIAEGDRVAVRWTTSATHRGEFMGVAPTGRRVVVGWFGMFRFSGDDAAVKGAFGVEESSETNAAGYHLTCRFYPLCKMVYVSR